MTESLNCSSCGREIPADAPQAICPNCLMQIGLKDSLSAVEATQKSPGVQGGFVPPTPAELAARFPQLEILELLGRGGMGAVYKARQPGLDRFVALKILPAEINQDPSFAERFTREARALARLSHPQIVAIYDFGRTDDGLFYFLMEYVDGVNLRQAIHVGGMPPHEALAIVPQICDALQFAHDEGVVHRDIKPENILLDRKGRVKIADFGLAKLIGVESPDLSLTGTRQVMGTLRYMAPEQLEGAKAVDHRADIYSLGVVFYELLTGELPLGRFAPPSQRVQIDVRFDEVVLRALERDPEQRYQHASDVKTQIESVASNALPADVSAASGASKAAISPLEAARHVQLLVCGAMLFFSVLIVACGCVICALAFVVSGPGAGDFWGWMGGAIGCTIGGLGSFFGTWNTYRQLAGDDDMMQSPRWTWFDTSTALLAGVGALLLLFGLMNAFGRMTTTAQGALTIGGVLLFQGGLFQLIRWPTRKAAQVHPGTPRPPGSERRSTRKLSRVIGGLLLASMAIAVLAAIAATAFLPRPRPIIYSFAGDTGFVESSDGPRIGDALARRLGISVSQRQLADQIFQKFYREFVTLERRHTRHTRDADGRIHITISPFPDESLALAQRLQAELSGIVDQRVAPPPPERGKVHTSLGLFRQAGEATVNVELWKDAHAGQGHAYRMKESIQWIDGVSSAGRGFSGDTPAAFPEEYRHFWVEPEAVQKQ